MNIQNLFPLLEQRLAETRIYEVRSEGYWGMLDWVDEWFRELDPEASRNRKPPEYFNSNTMLKCSDMCARGPGRQTEVAQEWGLSLPLDYSSFCQVYAAYLLAGRLPVELLSVDEIKDLESIRYTYGVPRDAPRRLFPFAQVLNHTALYAFRWSEDFGRTDVVFVWDYGDVGEPHLLGGGGDRFVCDQDFTTWLSRLIKTDCFPSVPGRKVPTSDSTDDREETALKRVR